MTWRSAFLAWRRGGNALLALALLLLALAVWPPRLQLQRPVFTWQVNFDITQSMNVEDVELGHQAVSRLALARAAMRDVLAALPCGSRVGWTIFTSYRSLVLLTPLEVCGHYEELLASLDRIGDGMRWANASNIGRGVTWAVRDAKDIGPKTAFVFISDGQEAPPLRAGQKPPMGDITPGEVKGWVIGVGGDTPAPIPKIDSSGHAAGFWKAGDVVQGTAVGGSSSTEHLSELRQDYLQSLAKLVGANYARLNAPDALVKAMLDTRFAERRPAGVDLRWIPALLALLLLAWRFAPDGGWGRAKRFMPGRAVGTTSASG